MAPGASVTVAAAVVASLVAAGPICAPDAAVSETPGYPYSVQEVFEVLVKSMKL
jgi:hypothetical protein